MTKKHTYDLGVIGNCSFIAYIDKKANVQWMCMPSFDSDFIFGGLLDKERGGEFSVVPNASCTTRQYYISNTNVLCTEFECDDGSFRVTDYAPRFRQYDRYFRPLTLFRKIEVIKGSPFIRVKCRPVGFAGKATPDTVMGSNHIRYLNIGDQVRLTTNIPLTYILNETDFVLTENKYMAFSYGIPLEAALESTAEDFLEKTITYWQQWIKTTSISNYYQEHIIRSALVLKLHQYEDTGGIIASGSASLPEFNGSGRNWDYRYCWMRDSYYTLNAFNNIGHFEELEKYFRFMQNIIMREEGSRIQPLYSVTGKNEIREVHMSLAGYLGNVPVRFGNDAYTHVQNDVYGQLLTSLLPLYTDQRLVFADFAHKNKVVVHRLLDMIGKTIDEPDAGIWEFRNRKQYHTYTCLFHWAGANAAVKIARYYQDEALERKAAALVDKAAAMIEKSYDPAQQAYTQAVDSAYLDASCLQLISMSYLDPSSERAAKHLKAMEDKLHAGNGLFFRYLHEDDFGKPETTFLICAFWYVEALACVGRLDDAIRYFESLVQHTNHLGLLSEDVDMENGSQWGNFPQTYSHVGLMNAAYRIAKKLDRPLFI